MISFYPSRKNWRVLYVRWRGRTLLRLGKSITPGRCYFRVFDTTYFLSLRPWQFIEWHGETPWGTP